MTLPRVFIVCLTHGRHLWRGAVECDGCHARWTVVRDAPSPYPFRDPLTPCTCGEPLVNDGDVDAQAFLACLQCAPRSCPPMHTALRRTRYDAGLWKHPSGLGWTTTRPGLPARTLRKTP